LAELEVDRTFEDGGAVMDRLLYNAPVRLWPELFTAEPAPPWQADDFQRIPQDLGVPGLQELHRAWRLAGTGRIVWTAAPPTEEPEPDQP
jgi:hypothetical protein